VVPTFFPLIITIPEVIFLKSLQLIGYNFLYVFHRLEMMTFQLRFQLREEVEITRSYIWSVGGCGGTGMFFFARNSRIKSAM